MHSFKTCLFEKSLPFSAKVNSCVSHTFFCRTAESQIGTGPRQCAPVSLCGSPNLVAVKIWVAATSFEGTKARLGTDLPPQKRKAEKRNAECRARRFSTTDSYSASSGLTSQPRDRLSLGFSLFSSVLPRECKNSTTKIAPRPPASSPNHYLLINLSLDKTRPTTK
jgi:hypothetical protein